MSEPKEKRGFWGLFRTKSSATKSGKLEKYGVRRASEGDAAGRRRRSEPSVDPDPASGSRPRRSEASVATKGKGREVHGSRAPESGPLTEWPPSGYSSVENLSLGHAMELISKGVPAFKGHKRPIPHRDGYFAFFSTAAGNKGGETDAANLHDSMTQLMTLTLLASGPTANPWETLEQPSCAFCFGKRPGTVTLNQWASLAELPPPPMILQDSGIAAREVELDRILERLKELERGLEDDDEDLMYKNLYRKLLRDPDKYRNPHKTLDRQITDLILVLSRPDWIDFTNPKNQIVTRFIFDTSQANHRNYQKFFHQLLLSTELYLRIDSRHHLEEAKERLMLQLPATIRWNLALARRWKENIRIEEYGKTGEQVRLRLKLRKRQVRMLKRFMQMMKWPNLADTLSALRQFGTDSTLDLISSHAMAFFSGLVLPGPTFPFLIMNSLIDIDPDRATDDLALLTHLHPHCGFQYRNSYTYWTATSIVGKVLAPTCHALGGWVGPARPTIDLGRSQIARIRCRRPRQQPTPEDVLSMDKRSNPLGPPTAEYPVKDYELPQPDMDDGFVDCVRIELLGLRPCADRSGEPGPGWFDASLQFAIDGVSWPLRLMFDVQFVCAWPCSDGPHPLFVDYVYEEVRADELVDIRDWNGATRGNNHDRSAKSSTTGGFGNDAGARSSPAVGGQSKKPATPGPATGIDPDADKIVLVVDAFGVPDNEVLARAWCSHWGLSAVVADISKTCMACAIREAYAAAMTVVILVDKSQEEEERDE